MANVEEFDKKKPGRRFDGESCVMLPSLSSQVNWEIRGKIQRERENEIILLNLFGLVFIKGQFKVSNNLHLSGSNYMCQYVW